MKTTADHTEVRELVDRLLEDDHQLIFRMKGYSMYPCLRPGDKGIVEKCAPIALRPGDIIVFYQQERLVAHRLIKRTETGFLTKGDHTTFYDAAVPADQLVGKLVSFDRGGKHFSTDSIAMRRIARFALKSGSLFTRLNRFRSLFIRLRMRIQAYRSSAARYSNDFKQNFRLASRDVKGLFTVNAGIAVLQGILPFAVIVLVKLLVDLLSTVAGQATMPAHFVWLLVLTGLAFLLSSVFVELKSWYGEKLAQGVARSVYARLHHRHIALELSHYENPAELDKMHRAVQEASFRPLKLLNEVQHLLKAIAASLFLVGIFISIRWYLVAILIVATLPGILLKVRFARRYHLLKDKQSPLERKMAYFNRVLTGFPFAKEMKLFGFAAYFLKRFRSLQQDVFKGKLDLRRSELSWNIGAQLFAVVLIFGTLALVAHWMVGGLLSIGTVVLFFFAFQRGYSVLNDLFRSMANLLEDTIFMNDLRVFVEVDLSADSAKKKYRVDASTEPASPTSFWLQHSIRVENVSFRYANSKRDALQSVSLTIPAGQTIAVVGANGSGKTTLIKLLCGFYLPDSGAIYYDSASTKDLGRATICNHLSAVFQDFALYNVTAGENIALGAIQQAYSIEKVQQAAREAGIADLLENLPEGYATILGNQFTGGEELSIGQWQKLAIARAFYRDAPLLLMDEPSSALDAISEQQIIESLKSLAHRKTALIISHRLSTVKWADRILVFDEGRVVEEGTHDELMLHNGHYATLYRQASRSFEE
jgi:ATP-binding cassette subfamily B protein